MFLQKTVPQNAKNAVISTKINISLREKEKTVSLVLLPATATVESQSDCGCIADIIDIMSL